MKNLVAQGEAELARLEGSKQAAERELERVKLEVKNLNVQLVYTFLASLMVIGIPFFLYLLAVKTPKLNRELKSAAANLRQIEDAITNKRIHVAELRAS